MNAAHEYKGWLLFPIHHYGWKCVFQMDSSRVMNVDGPLSFATHLIDMRAWA